MFSKAFRKQIIYNTKYTYRGYKMLKNTFKIIFFLSVITSSIYTQNKWIPFYNQESTAPTVNVSSSNNGNVSFVVQINGLNVSNKNVDEVTYQSLYIPDAEVITEEGLPQVPVITKLLAIPDCGDVSLSITPSNELVLSDYNILPAPRFDKEKQQDGTYIMDQVFEEDKNIYSSNVDFPGKYGEIIETGYCRGQKVARVAIYPVQFNPVAKTIKVNTDYNINLTFSNPSSEVNKELGIFRNVMHNAAINYEPSGISASQKLMKMWKMEV